MKKILSVLFVLLLTLLPISCGKAPAELPPVNTGISEIDPFSVEGDGAAGIVQVTSAKTAFNPLTGEYNLAEDRVGMRPIAVSVNNISLSWPQSGISQADYILEIETEGGITRMMCLFSDTREVDTIGSVRSLRDQFMEALFPLDPIIIHIGTSIYADRAMAQYNFRTVNGSTSPAAIWTDRVRLQSYSSEHCKFTGGNAIEQGILSADIKTEASAVVPAFNFIDPDAEKIIPAGGSASSVEYNFSSGYDGDFRYDEETGKYLKWQFGRIQRDANNDDLQLAFDNVILLYADISLIPGQDKGLVQVDYQAGGTGYYFSQGQYEEIEWRKDDYPSNFILTKVSDGTELLVNVGKTHMGIIRDSYADRTVITP